MQGKGSLEERAPGTWYLRAWDRRAGRQVRQVVKGTKREAETALARLVTKVEAGEVATSGTLTVAEYLDRWLGHVTPTLQPGTVRSYRQRGRRLTEEIGTVKLAKLTTRRVDQLYADLLAGGRSPATIKMHHSVLSAALRQAVKWELVPRAVTDTASPPRTARYRSTVPEVATVRQLVATAELTNPVLGAAIMLAAVTGCRRGELCGLRWSDIDAERRVLHVRRAVKQAAVGNGVVVGPTKTHQERRVSVDDVTLAVLAAHRARAEGWATDAGVTLEPDGYLLTLDPTGTTPMTPNVITRGFLRVTGRAGVSCRFHDLRHFTATQLIGSGQDVTVVAGRLGHLDASTTLRVYSHALAERDRAAAEYLGALMAPSPG